LDKTLKPRLSEASRSQDQITLHPAASGGQLFWTMHPIVHSYQQKVIDYHSQNHRQGDWQPSNCLESPCAIQKQKACLKYRLGKSVSHW
jgi:hypothetical protein